MLSRLVIGIVCVCIICSVHQTVGQSAAEKTYSWRFESGRVFGSPEDVAKTIDYYKQGCENCIGNTYRHKQACNAFIMCVPNGDIVNMYGFFCGRGLVYSPNAGCVFPEDVPECASCTQGSRMPVSATECWEYQECVNGQYVSRTCPAGRGYDMLTQDCTADNCLAPPTINILRYTCSNGVDEYHYRVDQSMEQTRPDGTTFIENTEVQVSCPAAMKHVEADSCLCQRYDVSSTCEDIESVHLSSADDTWRRALNNTPVGISSSITGNATIATMGSLLPGSAYFGGRNTFLGHAIRYNDLGLRFEIKFNFQPMRIVQGQNDSPGLSNAGSGSSNRFFALADNSICGVTPTYGCKLELTRDNRGTVQCYINPENQTVLDVLETSDELDLTRTISVRFARDVTMGRFEVSEGGTPKTQKDLVFPEASAEIRSGGNMCPLAIGAGSNKNYFSGFIDELYITKYCASFL